MLTCALQYADVVVLGSTTGLYPPNPLEKDLVGVYAQGAVGPAPAPAPPLATLQPKPPAPMPNPADASLKGDRDAHECTPLYPLCSPASPAMRMPPPATFAAIFSTSEGNFSMGVNTSCT